MQETVEPIVRQLIAVVTTYGLDVIGAIAILIVGWIAAGWAHRAVGNALGRIKQFDQTLRSFAASVARYLVIIITILAVLSQFGIQTASLLAVFGAAGLAVGLALQGTLGNVAAGVMLLVFRPFKVGDYVEAGGLAGTVKSLSLFVTELTTADNVQILAPNGQIWGSAVKNYSFHATRRLDLGIGIGYEDDIDAAFAAIHAVIGGDGRVLGEPAAMVAVGELADSSVNLVIRVWCNAGDYWPLKFDLTKALKERFDAEGISIPFPQRSVHLVPGTPEGAGTTAAE